MVRLWSFFVRLSRSTAHVPEALPGRPVEERDRLTSGTFRRCASRDTHRAEPGKPGSLHSRSVGSDQAVPLGSVMNRGREMLSGTGLSRAQSEPRIRTFTVHLRVRNRAVKFSLKATSPAEAATLTHRIFFHLNPNIERIQRTRFPRQSRLTLDTKADLLTAVHEYIQSSLSVYQALIEYGSMVPSPGVAGVVFQMAAGMAEGRTLADVIADSGEFSPVDVEVIRASERTGTLDEALAELAGTFRQMADLKRTMRQLLVTPVAVGIGLLIAATVYRFVLIPAYIEMMRAFGSDLPVAIQWFRAMYDTLPLWIPLILLLIYRHKRSGVRVLTPSKERWLRHIPWLWPILINRDLVRIYTVFRHALRAGLAPGETYRMMQDTVRLPTLRRVVGHLVASVESPRSRWFGRSPGEILLQAPDFPSRDAGLIEVGCASGSLERIVERLLIFRINTLERLIKEALRMMEPAMIFFLGLLVLATAIMFYGPFFDLVNRVY